jgi:hypothetical protein
VIAHAAIVPQKCKQAAFGLVFVFVAYAGNSFYPNVVLCSQSIKNGFPLSASYVKAFDVFTQQFAKHEATSFGALSISHDPWYDLTVYSGVKWNLSINHYWMASYFEKYPASLISDSSLDWRDQYMVDKTIEDFEKRKPDVIFVPEAEVSALPILMKSKIFSKAWIKYYHFSTDIRFCSASAKKSSSCVYHVYKRNEN